MRVTAFPWGSLERLPRQALGRAREARRALERAVRVEALGRAASELLSTETLIVLGKVGLGSAPPHALGLELADGSRVSLALEPALVSALVGRVLGRPLGLTAPDTPLDPTLAGALAAILIEIARRSGAPEPLARGTYTISDALEVSATVVFEGKPYAARAWVDARPAAPPEARLSELGSLPIAVPLVTALCLAAPGELATLSLGDAWLPGFWQGKGALASPRGERGISVSFSPGGEVVVGDEIVELRLDVEGAMSSTNDELGGALEQAVLDAPVVVRVEVGAVSLSAREWAALRPGDVIETGRRINEPVVLRVAGREVARGELVEVEGELGVRIREVLP